MTRNRSGRDVGRLLTRVLAGVLGAMALGMLVRELPAAVRYIKIKSM